MFYSKCLRFGDLGRPMKGLESKHFDKRTIRREEDKTRKGLEREVRERRKARLVYSNGLERVTTLKRDNSKSIKP